MKKPVKEESVRTIAVALVGFAALMIAVPDWARTGVLVFAGVVAVLTYVVDPGVRSALRFGLDSRLHGNDTTSAPAKSPDGRRAAT
jgi:hypothetical protein